MTSQELKNSILQFAVQGKLVPQDPNDEPVSELLKSIRAEKELLIKDGKIKKEKQLSPITEDEIPFDIPESWQWVIFEQIGYFSSGYTPKQDNISNIGVIPYFKISDMNNSDNQKYLIKTKFYLKAIQARLFKKNSIVYPKNGGAVYTNKRRILANDSVVDLNTGVYTLYLENMLPYIFLIFKRIDFKNYSIASPLPTLDMTAIRKIPIPLPPLAEQQRIVARIEELMPLVEEYGKAEERLTALNAKFPDKIRKSILQQAIQGKLTERDSADEPASELLKRIRAEKERLIKEGKLKKEKLLPPIAEEEVPFDIPDGWVWVRLQQIVFSREQETPTERFSYIDIGSIDNQRQCLNTKETLIDPENAPSRARKLVELGDILYSTVRPYLHNMCIIDREFSYKPIASTGFAVLACCAGVYNKFLFYYLLSPAFDNYVNDTAKGAAYPAINDNQLFRALIPLPPFAEQKRIVDRVNKLLAVCDELK